MSKDGRLLLDLLDTNGKRLKEKVDISLRHRVLGDRRLVKQADASRRLSIRGLHRAPQGVYDLLIDPPSYQPVARIVQIQSSGDTEETVHFPVDPGKVKEVAFPGYPDLDSAVRDILTDSDAVLSFENKKGRALYDAMDTIRKSGFMNIVAKSRDMVLPNHRSVFDYVHQVTELRGDRFFAVVSRELREEVKNSVATGLFDPAPDGLHHPPEGFDRAGSFKSDDRYGNLQVTFFARNDEWRADIDIDDASGLGHVFQVVRNFLTGRPTHPFDIREILLIHQGLDPGYYFKL